MLINLRCIIIILKVCFVFQTKNSHNEILFHSNLFNESAKSNQFKTANIYKNEGVIIGANSTQYVWSLYRGNKTYLEEDEEPLTTSDAWDNVNTLFVAVAATVSLVLLVGCPLLCIKRNRKTLTNNHDAENRLDFDNNGHRISTVSEMLAGEMSNNGMNSPSFKVKPKTNDKPPSYENAIQLRVEEEGDFNALPSYQQAVQYELIYKVQIILEDSHRSTLSSS